MSAAASKPRLIVTADDFGVSPEVNEAVIRASREGILRFASLMVCEPAAEEAVERARKESPGLRLGLHVVLCAGRSADGGAFPDDPVLCGLRYFFDRRLEAGLERELRAQFERFLAFGLPPGHVDGHLNIHAHPVVYPMLVRLCKEYGFPRLRLPGGEFCLSMAFPRRRLWKESVEALVFSLLRTYLLKAYGDSRVETPDRVLGLLRSGLMKEDYAAFCLERLPGGLSEIYFHPSAEPSSEAGDRPTPTHRTVSELRTLLSDRVREALALRGAELVGGA